MNYTKGTWHAKDGEVYPEETGRTIARIMPMVDVSEEESNAQLIAAAPELFEALVKLYNFILLGEGYLDMVLNTAESAILKATNP